MPGLTANKIHAVVVGDRGGKWLEEIKGEGEIGLEKAIYLFICLICKIIVIFVNN